MKLSDILIPDSFTIEDFGHKRPTKVFVAGRHWGKPPQWFALYADVHPEVLAKVEPRLVDGKPSAMQLAKQWDTNELVAVFTPRCMIGQVKFAVVDSLGDCVLPHPFQSLEDLVR